MLDEREAFRRAVLARCAEDGLTGPGLAGRLALVEKRAADPQWGDTLNKILVENVGKPLGWAAAGQAAGMPQLGAGIGAVQSPLAQNAGLIALGLSGAAGAGVGWGLGKLQSGHVEPEEVRKQELVAAYNTFAEQVRNSDKLRLAAGAARPHARLRGPR